MNFVFHGGSGSSPEEISEAVSYGVVKMNIDTDTQWAFTHPIKQFMDEKGAYLMSQIGNPEGPDKPNKKYIDPRGWAHVGEKGMTGRLVQAFKELGAFGKFEFYQSPARVPRPPAGLRQAPAPRCYSPSSRRSRGSCDGSTLSEVLFRFSREAGLSGVSGRGEVVPFGPTMSLASTTPFVRPMSGARGSLFSRRSSSC